MAVRLNYAITFFNLDDFGTQLTENLPRERRGDTVAQLDDDEAGEGMW